MIRFLLRGMLHYYVEIPLYYIFGIELPEVTDFGRGRVRGAYQPIPTGGHRGGTNNPNRRPPKGGSSTVVIPSPGTAQYRMAQALSEIEEAEENLRMDLEEQRRAMLGAVKRERG